MGAVVYRTFLEFVNMVNLLQSVHGGSLTAARNSCSVVEEPSFISMDSGIRTGGGGGGGAFDSAGEAIYS